MAQLTLDGTPALVAGGSEAPVLDVPFAGHYGTRAVACPSCRADAGSNCRRPSGHSPRPTFGGFHAARKNLAARVRLIGLSCARCGAPDDPLNYVAPILDDRETLGLPICQRCVDDWREDRAADPAAFGPSATPHANLKRGVA